MSKETMIQSASAALADIHKMWVAGQITFEQRQSLSEKVWALVPGRIYKEVEKGYFDLTA